MGRKTLVGKLLNPIGTVASAVGVNPDTALVRGFDAQSSMGLSEASRAIDRATNMPDLGDAPSPPSDDMLASAQDKAAAGQRKARGRASTMLTGSKGVSTKTASVTSAGRTLLG